MSSSGYPHHTAENSSGRCVMEAPISKPPFDRPVMAKCSGDVYLLAIKYSAAANQSSKTFCFFSNMACSCQVSPYSPPPRRLGRANQPPCSIHQAQCGFQSGSLAQIESAVSGHQQPLGSVPLQPLLSGNEHGNARSVLRLEKNLLQLILAGVKGNLRPKKHLALASHRIQPVNRPAAE